jgi:hypothetical protein
VALFAGSMNLITLSDQNPVTIFIQFLQLNPDGLVHVQTIFVVISSVNMYMQLNFIAIRTQHFSSLNYVSVVVITIFVITNGQYLTLAKSC